MSSSSNDNDSKREEWIVRSLDSKKDPNSAMLDTNIQKVPTRLILHLDINETILLGDAAGGDTRHDSVQKMLAKSAFCQLPTTSKTSWEDTQQVEPTHWWDGQPIGQEKSLPPLYTGWDWPENCCPYYRTNFKKYAKKFVEKHHGGIYQPILDECENELAKSNGADHILPAFYHTLNYLMKLKKDVGEGNEIPITLVFRTFGSDIDELAKSVTTFAKENNCSWLELSPEKLYRGRWEKLEDGSVVYQLWNQQETKLVASSDAEILNMLDQGSVFGIRDDYNYWKENEWYPTAGKPVWIPTYTTEQPCFDHHLLFDDNIHNLPNDGIACVRKQLDDGRFVTVDGSTMHEESQGVHLIRVPTVEPVLNPNWFVEQIEKARERLQRRLQRINQ